MRENVCHPDLHHAQDMIGYACGQRMRSGMACCGLDPTFGAMQLMQVDAFDVVLVTLPTGPADTCPVSR